MNNNQSEPSTSKEYMDHMRKRPSMYIGNDGVAGLLRGFLVDCIELCKSDKITFKIIISGDDDFSIHLESPNDLTVIVEKFNEDRLSQHYFPNVMKALSGKFDLNFSNKNNLEINFSIDHGIFSDVIDSIKLDEKIITVALLNRQSEIVTIDNRKKYFTQNYYHFPEGIFYLFNRATKEVLGKPEFLLTFDDTINSRNYQIGLAYRTDWFPKPNIISFANDVHTVCGGSLVDGVMDGLINACRIYVKENNLSTFKIKRKKFLNGLVLVCTVRGAEFIYGGSWKETLESEEVKKDAKKLMSKLALEFFRTHKEQTDKFLWRFDTEQFASGMY
ncbi:MAG: hypothetical protein IPM74_13835 [Crocinitomicaceae bacterium]|nr:hypothetical protein [Crocinitomicaceae bacterium]MBK8926953.1 hypothetical protein [Crocinitomicaceae bacterium]